jgi:hypothetical protein
VTVCCAEWAYELTELGRALEPAVHALGSWGWHRMGVPRSGDHRSLEWLLVALRRRYLGGEELVAELAADGETYHVVLTRERAGIGRGPAGRWDVRLSGPGKAMAPLFMADAVDAVDAVDASGAERAGVVVEGDREAVARLLGAFRRGDRLVERRLGA